MCFSVLLAKLYLPHAFHYDLVAIFHFDKSCCKRDDWLNYLKWIYSYRVVMKVCKCCQIKICSKLVLWGVACCFCFLNTNTYNLYTFNFQSISKEALYGNLDPNTREWTDGLFTHILRK